MATSDRLQNDTSDSEEGPSILRDFTSAQSSLEGKPSPLTSLPTKTQTLTPSSLLPLLLTALLLSGRGEVPIISGPANYRPNIVQVLKELAPEMNCDLVLQHLSEVDTDYLVECVLEIARRYRQLEENESYRQRKEVFANLYEKERGKVKELKTKLAETSRAMEKMKKESADVVEHVRQGYLKERRQLEAECERLKCVLKHEEEKWMKEKQLLLEQIRNVRSEQRIEKERRELAGMNDHTSKIEVSSNVLDFPQQSGPHNPPRVGHTDVGTGTHFTVNPALPTTAGMEEGYTLPTMAGMEGGHRPPTCALLVTDTTSLLLPWRPMQTTWQLYAHLSKNYNRIHTQTSNTHEMSEYTEDGEDLPSPVEETMYYERGRGVVQYSLEETGQHRTQEMVSGKLPF